MKTIAPHFAAAVLLILAIFCTAGQIAHAQEPLDGPTHIFNDELLENLVGEWKLSRQIRGRTVENTVNTFTWSPADKTWTFLGEHKNKEGKWTTFAQDKLRRP